jgi:thiamine-monophosphate kinase
MECTGTFEGVYMGKKLSTLGEFGVIDIISRDLHPRHSWVKTGIGDDCAVLDIGGGLSLLVTTDMLIERVHFLPQKITPYQLGWKALAVNVSDIAAMGGEPKAAFLALGLLPTLNEVFVHELKRGLIACADEFQVDLLGGDTVTAPTEVTVCLTVLGTAPADQVVRRAGAKPGDLIWLGGVVGDSTAGLHLLLDKPGNVPESEREQLVRAHLEPQPQVELGRWLAANSLATAMIDVSDGVLQDLWHVCDQSGVGAKVDADKLPVSPAARQFASSVGLDARDWALAGGEDYVLLFCTPPEKRDEVLATCPGSITQKPTKIGRITAERQLRVCFDGVWSERAPSGYDAFKKK